METVHFKNLADFKSMVGKALPSSGWIVITQQMINDFAEATQDKQWVHVDDERAKRESPFKTTIAHGFMSLSMLSKMLEDVIKIDSVTMGFNYGLNKVRFPHPVPVNSRLQLNAIVKDIEDQKGGVKITFSCAVTIEGIEKPACIAEFLAIMFE